MDFYGYVQPNSWRPEMIEGLLPDNMYEYVKTVHSELTFLAAAHLMQRQVLGENPSPERQVVLDAWYELQKCTPNDLQRFFVKLSEKIPSGRYEGQVRHTLPDDRDRCPSFEVFADAIVDILDELTDQEDFPERPPRDHPIFASDTYDLSLLGHEYGAFRQRIVDTRVALNFQMVLHATKPTPLIKYTFKNDLTPSQKRRLDEWEKHSPHRAPPPRRYR